MSESNREEIQQTPRDKIVESGIAERMLASIKKHRGTEDPEITFGIEDCDFRVQMVEDPRSDDKYPQVVIEMPNLHPENRKKQPRVTQAFGVEGNESFGAADEAPLTEEQFSLVQGLATKTV